MFKKIVFTTLLILILFPFAALGAEEQLTPQNNSLCWKEEDCRNARQQFIRDSNDRRLAEGGWIREAPCASPGWGKCLPIGAAETQIAFGGQRRFLHAGEFILAIYNYAVRVAGIVAVVVIIIAGIQWTTSGGGEGINSAKKRIGGALMGLFLAYMSYLILHTINPALVNMRLPQVWMLRRVAMERFGSQMPVGTRLILAAEANNQTGRPNMEAAGPAHIKSADESQNRILWCGKRFRQDPGNEIVWGDYCDAGQVCVEHSGNTRFFCEQGAIFGEIVNSGNSDWTFPWTDEGETELWAVCNNGVANDISVGLQTFNLPNNRQNYVVKANYQEAIRLCGSEDQIKGFALMLEMNESDDPTDEEHLIGAGGVDLGENSLDRSALAAMDAGRFIPPGQIQAGGLRMDIDVVRIRDVDD